MLHVWLGTHFFIQIIIKLLNSKCCNWNGVLLFIGGIFNYLNLAYQSSIEFLFFIGMIIFIIKVFINWHHFQFKNLLKILEKFIIFFYFQLFY